MLLVVGMNQNTQLPKIPYFWMGIILQHIPIGQENLKLELDISPA